MRGGSCPIRLNAQQDPTLLRARRTPRSPRMALRRVDSFSLVACRMEAGHPQRAGRSNFSSEESLSNPPPARIDCGRETIDSSTLEHLIGRKFDAHRRWIGTIMLEENSTVDWYTLGLHSLQHYAPSTVEAVDSQEGRCPHDVGSAYKLDLLWGRALRSG